MIYDGVITKPELNEENMLMHWGVKGMKWRKRIKGSYYKMKSKLSSLRTKRLRGLAPVDMVTQDIREQKKAGGFIKTLKIDNGKESHKSGQTGSRVNAGIAAGRQRRLEQLRAQNRIEGERPRSRKKKIISGSGSVKRREKV